MEYPKSTWILRSEGTSQSRIDKHRYISEYFGYDDFVCSLRVEARLKLKLNSVAAVADFSDRHAYTATVMRDGLGTPVRIVAVEPQTDGEVPERSVSYEATKDFAIF